jgi:hypothetical protein
MRKVKQKFAYFSPIDPPVRVEIQRLHSKNEGLEYEKDKRLGGPFLLYA